MVPSQTKNNQFVSSQESASTNPSSSYGGGAGGSLFIDNDNSMSRSPGLGATTTQQPPSPQLLPQSAGILPASFQSRLDTPWTLGSTNGAYALQLIGYQQQQVQQQQREVQGGVMIAPTGDATSDIISSNAMYYNGLEHAPIATLHVDHSQDSGASVLLNQSGSNHSAPGNVIVASSTNDLNGRAAIITNQRSLFQDRLLRQPSSCVESILAAACQVMAFDIAEVWLRTGPKTHQLTNSHLRPTALADDAERRSELVDVYYGEKSSERTHRLSPALCKRAKEAQDVVWITAHTPNGADALRCSISNVRTAVALPVCHEASNTNLTILFFSIRRILVKPPAVEFLVHMALSAGVTSVNSLAEDGLMDRSPGTPEKSAAVMKHQLQPPISHSEHLPMTASGENDGGGIAIRHQRMDRFSVTGAQLDLQWRQLFNVEYLTDGGNSWIHTAVFNGKPVVVKTLKPECQDVAVAINEIEGELAVHSRLNHLNICALIGAGTTSKGVRFVVLERLDGGTLTQMLGYDTRIRDRRRRFWRKKVFSFLDIVRIAKSIAEAMMYCHEEAIPGSVVMHRDLKPDNIGFTLDGTVKILDFGLAKIIESASVDSNDVYMMSGETGR
ncbi:hypothetical protein MPSEU_000145800 [Mayamaea pseudoterrestris]|nr:hypothetical protein MPSEU_000145800 [Mayamaea pseudoterrestris]